MSFKHARVPNMPPSGAATRARVAPFGGAAVDSLFNVEGGHRAVIFNRKQGIKDKATCMPIKAEHGTSPSIQNSSSADILLADRLIPIQGNYAPLVQAIKSTANQDVSCFHFPGHNRGKAAPRLLSGLIGMGAFLHDLPQLPELDGLFNPRGVIWDAQNQASELFGSSKTWFLVGGTTCGIQASIMATCPPGTTLVLPRNSHISAASGMVISGAVPKYIVPEYNSQWDIAGGATPAQVENALRELEEEERNASAVLVTSPTYHGICSDLEGIAGVCHSRNIPLIVDEAHGAHFAFHRAFPRTALEQGADLVVQSTHKVLNSLTQSSMLHMAGDLVDMSKISKCLQALQSSSPSYLLLASLDATRACLSNDTNIFDEAVDISLQVKTELMSIPGLSFLGPSSFVSRFPAIDPLRITLGTSLLHVSGFIADEVLEEHRIVSELVGTRSVTFAINLGTRRKDGTRLVLGVRHLSERFFRVDEDESGVEGDFCAGLLNSSCIRLSPREAFFAEKRAVPTEECVGKICGELVCPYPPGIPVLIPGEVISEEALSYLLDLRNMGATITGAADEIFSEEAEDDSLPVRGERQES